jgi:CheY-like chemotaxis protein
MERVRHRSGRDRLRDRGFEPDEKPVVSAKTKAAALLKRRATREAGARPTRRGALIIGRAMRSVEVVGARVARRTQMIHPPATRPNPRILVVDDDPLVGRSVSRALRSHADVVFELEPEVALERVRRGERFDLILSDVTMPGMPGPHFFERVVALAPEQREVFVFASGGMSGLLREMLAATGCPCLQKPVTRKMLLELLKNVRKIAVIRRRQDDADGA